MRWMWRWIQQITMRICGFLMHTSALTVAFDRDFDIQKCWRSIVAGSHFSFEKISGPKRSIKITDRFICTSANVISCITCTLCKKLYIGETWRRLGDRFREHLRDVEKDDQSVSKSVARHVNLPKGGEIRDTKTLNLSCNIVSLQVLVHLSRFSPCVINLSRNENTCCRLKKVVAKSRAQVYFVQQILALLLVFHQTHNLARNKFARALANQPIRALHFFDLQQMFLLRIKLIMRGEKRETSTKTCNETMFGDKLRVFVSRISPP